jgi:hypothetical protein
MLYTILVSAILAHSKKPKAQPGNKDKDCTKEEEATLQQLVANETAITLNGTELVKRLQDKICSTKCGRTVLEGEDYFKLPGNSTKLPGNSTSEEAEEALHSINDIECNHAFISQASLAILFVLLA